MWKKIVEFVKTYKKQVLIGVVLGLVLLVVTTPELKKSNRKNLHVAAAINYQAVLSAKADLQDMYAVFDMEAEPPVVMLDYTVKGVPVLLKNIPIMSFSNFEKEVLLKEKIPYTTISKMEYDRRHAPKTSGFSAIMLGLVKMIAGNFWNILVVGILLLSATGALFSLRKKHNIVMPEDIDGSMDDLVGMEDIKAEVLRIKDMLENPEAYAQHDLKRPPNVMLTGPSGTGKTKLTQYLAKAMNVPLIHCSAAELETGLVGGGSNTLKAMYREADKHPVSILFLDEAQGMFRPRGGAGGESRRYDDDTPNTFLSLTDGVTTKSGNRVIWVVASNFDDVNSKMDEAALRRFEMKINFRLPNREERLGLFKFFVGKKDAECVDPELNVEYLADITAKHSPADIEIICRQASMLAIEKKSVLTEALLFEAFKRTQLGLSDRATTKGLDAERRRIARHEVGHAIVEVVQNIEKGMTFAEAKAASSLLVISTEANSKMGALGFVLSKEEEVHLETYKDLCSRVMHLYGGCAAEEQFYGAQGLSTGAYNDIEKVTHTLDLMVTKLSMASASKLNYAVLAGSLQARREETIDELERMSSDLYQKTQAIIKEHAETIDTIAEALVARYTLTKAEFFELLEKKSSLTAW